MKNRSNYEVSYAIKISPNFTLLGEYITMHDNTLIRCNRCKEEWSPTPTNFLRRIKCKFCENKTIKKPNITPDMVLLSGTPCILYVLRIVNLDNYEDFCLKVGITLRDLKYRLASIKSELGNAFEVTVLHTYVGDEKHIRILEKIILRNLKNYKYSPSKVFSGDTELLAFDSYNRIIDLMEKHGYII